MIESQERTIELAIPAPALQASIGMPPLKMVLVGVVDEDDKEHPKAGDASDPAASEAELKAEVVRRIIEHLQKGL